MARKVTALVRSCKKHESQGVRRAATPRGVNQPTRSFLRGPVFLGAFTLKGVYQVKAGVTVVDGVEMDIPHGEIQRRSWAPPVRGRPPRCAG